MKQSLDAGLVSAISSTTEVVKKKPRPQHICDNSFMGPQGNCVEVANQVFIGQKLWQ